MPVRFLALLLTLLLLGGCLHTQLNGSIAGAGISIAELRSPGTVVFTTQSADETSNIALYGQAEWDGFNALIQHWLFGVFFVEADNFDAETLYLVTASGGVETDANRDNLADANPVPVSHDWHAIMSGAQLADRGYKVTALSEAAYRWVAADIDGLSDAGLLARLDSAAAPLVTDLNEDGVINYADVIFWTRLVNAETTFHGDFDLLNTFSEELVSGSSENSLDSLAAQIMESASSSNYDADYWRQVTAELDEGSFATDAFLYATTPDPDFCIDGSLTQAARDRALQAANQIRTLHGLSALSYSPSYDEDVQRGALIQRANSFLSHFPPADSACFREDGADAAATGNISGSSVQKDPVDDVVGWTNDSFNISTLAAAGHRRWVLNPFGAYMAYGQVDGYAVQKVFDFDQEPAITPAIEADFVAFPYLTYPHLFVSDDPDQPTPWSFSVIEDKTSLFANQHDYFSNATIAVTRASDGSSLAVTEQYSDSDGFGIPNFMSWQVPDWEYDTQYQVDIGNVSMQSGQQRVFSYSVFIDFANLVDRTEPLEAGDSKSGRLISGSLANNDDADSYLVNLGGTVTITGSSQFSNQGFFLLLYGPDKQLVRSSNEGFTINVDSGEYTLVVSNCSDSGSCFFHGGVTNYEVVVNP